jgi:hypothetical protein
MVGKRIADALQLTQRGIQWSLLDATFAHYIAQQRYTSLTRASGSERASQVRSCHTTCEQFSNTTPNAITSVAPAHPDCC